MSALPAIFETGSGLPGCSGAADDRFHGAGQRGQERHPHHDFGGILC
jgi:hypothetical protein